MAEYQTHYRDIFERNGLINTFLITPQTSDARIREIDEASDGFIYMVSSASTTGAKTGFQKEQSDYFERIANMHLKNPQIVGFGISNAETFATAARHAKGAIIGSAFIKMLRREGIKGIERFVQQFRE